MAQKVSFGLTLPNRGIVLGITTVKEMLALSVEAERSGVFDSIWAGDSIAAKPRLEAIALLSAVAARTERVKLGPACFASFPLRHPVLLAYQWASFDVICEGRSIMVACQGARGGISGDSETEWAAMGMDLSERAHRLEEGIEILRKLWSGDKVSHQGRFYQFQNLTIEPKPVQNPCPIWIANNPHVFGASEKLLNHIARRVARLADGWQTTFTTPEGFKLAWARIVQQGKEIGRDVSKMPRCLYYNCHINEGRAMRHCGNPRSFSTHITQRIIPQSSSTSGWRWAVRRSASTQSRPMLTRALTSSPSASPHGTRLGNSSASSTRSILRSNNVRLDLAEALGIQSGLTGHQPEETLKGGTHHGRSRK